MRLIFDNIIFSLQRAGGISVVWQNLLEELLSSDLDMKCLEYEGALSNLHRGCLKLPEEIIERRKLYSKVFQQFVRPAIKSDCPYVFHSSYFRVSTSKLARNVTTVHDFIYERQPRMSISQKIRTYLNHDAIMKSDAIVCISMNTRNDLMRYLPDVSSKKVYVINNGVSDDYHRLSEIDESFKDYVMYVGGRQYYKNFEFAVEAIADSKFKLLVCGAPLDEREKHYLDVKLGFDGYKCVERPSNSELNRIYNSAAALLYPSSYEGFGLPVLEAQKAGCPVLALNASSIPEIIGNDVLLLNDLDIKEVKRKLSVLDDVSAREDIVMSGFENASKYSWRRMADEYKEVYKELLA